MKRIIGGGCGPLLEVDIGLRREVRPARSYRLELVAIAAALSALGYAFLW